MQSRVGAPCGKNRSPWIFGSGNLRETTPRLLLLLLSIASIEGCALPNERSRAWSPSQPRQADLAKLVRNPERALVILSPRKNFGTALSPCGGKLFLYAGEDGHRVRAMDLSTKKVIRDFLGHRTPIKRIVLDAQGRLICGNAWDGSAILWKTDTGEIVHQWSDLGETSALSFSPDGSRLVASLVSGPLVIVDTSSGRVIDFLRGHSKGAAAVLSAWDGSLYSTGADSTLIRWDLASGKRIDSHEINAGPQYDLDVAPLGQYVYLGGEDSRLRRWDPETRRITASPAALSSPILTVTATPDLAYVLTGHEDGSIALWSATDLKHVHTFSTPWGPVYDLAIGLAGTPLVSVHHDGRTIVWNGPLVECEREGQAWGRIPQPDRDRIIQDLASPDYLISSHAAALIQAAGAEALRELIHRIPRLESDPIAGEDLRRIEALVTALDDEDPTIRSKALCDLEVTGSSARDWIDARLRAGIRSIEAATSLARILSTLESRPPDEYDLGRARSVLVASGLPKSPERDDTLEYYSAGSFRSHATRLARMLGATKEHRTLRRRPDPQQK
jgi:hypothetical protein